MKVRQIARMGDLDMVVFGATGFAGELVCEYLLSAYPDVKWGAAGRSPAKVNAVIQRLTDRFGSDATVRCFLYIVINCILILLYYR